MYRKKTVSRRYQRHRLTRRSAVEVEMSSDCPDDAMFKAKYAEIAALKKAIEMKQSASGAAPTPMHSPSSRPYPTPSRSGPIRTKKTVNKTYRPYPYLPPKPANNNFKALHKPVSNMTAVFNSGETTAESPSDGKNQYLVSGNKLTLVRAAIERQKMQNEIAKAGLARGNGHKWISPDAPKIDPAKKAATKSAHAQKQRADLLESKLNAQFYANLPKYLAQNDACDRIQIEGNRYAVTRGGARLVPLEYFKVDTKSKQIEWNEMEYLRSRGPILKTKLARDRYVIYLSQIPITKARTRITLLTNHSHQSQERSVPILYANR